MATLLQPGTSAPKPGASAETSKDPFTGMTLLTADGQQPRAKAAVEKAGSTKVDGVIKSLADVAVDGPRGTIKMNKERHAPLTMYLGQVGADGGVKVIKAFKDVEPGDQCPDLK